MTISPSIQQSFQTVLKYFENAANHVRQEISSEKEHHYKLRGTCELNLSVYLLTHRECGISGDQRLVAFNHRSCPVLRRLDIGHQSNVVAGSEGTTVN